MSDLERDQEPLRPLSARRLAVTVAGALGLLVVVVVASRGERPAGGTPGGGQTAEVVLVNVMLLIGAVVAAAVIVTILLSVSPGKAPQPKPRTGPRLAGQMIFVVLFVCAAVAAFTLLRGGRGNSGDQQNPGALRTNPLAGLEREADRKPPPEVDFLPIILVFGGALLAFTATGIVMLRRGPLPDPTPTLADRLSQVFDETLGDLYAERDPRLAVIRAYARMERTLAGQGMPRRPAEAPHEYVARVLEDVTASAAAVRRLTRLFERAKFSPHDVDPRMKNEAIEALEQIRDEVKAREAEPLIAAPH
ncbi:MAG: DUF4129 domain-containing protein [Gaiellaceae bacterium]